MLWKCPVKGYTACDPALWGISPQLTSPRLFLGVLSFVGQPSLFLFGIMCPRYSPQSWASRAWNRVPSEIRFLARHEACFPFPSLHRFFRCWPEASACFPDTPGFLHSFSKARFPSAIQLPASLLCRLYQLSPALLERQDLLSSPRSPSSWQLWRFIVCLPCWFSLKLTEEKK